MRIITQEQLESYRGYLIDDEKSAATVNKYFRDVQNLFAWVSCREIDKTTILAYKIHLVENYAPSSVNAALSSINSFFHYVGWYDLCVKSVKIQRQAFVSDEKELSKMEYQRLLQAAQDKRNVRLCLLMQTICSTGIRVSELRYITVGAIGKMRADICCKGKRRTVFLPDALCQMLRQYIFEKKIKEGPVFVTKNGKPLDRSNIWSDMKKLCRAANVSEQKIFPHNLRHLFARTYYTSQKDIVRLADILGHSSVNTTRIYTMESGMTHRRQIQNLDLLRRY